MSGFKEVLDNNRIKQTLMVEHLGRSYKIVDTNTHEVQKPSLEEQFDIANILNVDVDKIIVSSKK
jgi:hypothetical protein